MNHSLRKISTGKAVRGIILAIVILVLAQLLSMLIGNIFVTLSGFVAVGNVVAGILYPVITFYGMKLILRKVLNLSLEDCRVTKFSLKPLWCVVAFIMPCMVMMILILFSGHWEKSITDIAAMYANITGAIVFYGAGTGIVEEMIFRGVIMSLLEYRCNKVLAVVVPSVLFGVLHILGNNLDVMSMVQLLIAGSIVGILFSLVTYESGSIWNGALIHSVWNTIIIGGIWHIGNSVDEQSIYNYVLDTNSFLVTGGDFGIEASIIAVMMYLFFVMIAIVLIKRKVKTE